VAAQLKIPPAQIDARAPFSRYGVDSILVMQLTSELEKTFGPLPKTLFFEYPTLQELHAYFVEAQPDALHRWSAVEAAPGPPPGRLPTHGFASSGARVPLRASVPAQSDSGNRIAVIGLNGRFPQASDIERFWEKLRAGADCIGMVPPERWDVARDFDPRKGEPGKTYGKWGGFIDGVDAFDPLFFGMSPREAELTDPQQRLFLETVWNLLERCGYTRDGLAAQFGGKVGVYVGSMYNRYDGLHGSGGAVSQSLQSAVANRVSHYFGLSGPSVAVDTMCSSFAVALHQACADLGRGDIAMAIAGAVNLSLDGHKFVALSQSQLLGSRAERRAFGDSDGYLPAETIGAVLLKPLWMAERDGDDIWGVIRGTAVNHAGGTQAYSVPNLHAQVEVMREVMRRAGVAPGELSYVEAAASGSALGDVVEVASIGKVMEGEPCPIGSVKSNMGHAEAASGLSQLAKVLLQLRHGELVPTIGTEPPNPNLRLDEAGLRLQRHREPWARPVRMDGATPREMPRLALINSFGAGGSNASLVVEEYRGTMVPARRAGRTGAQVIVLSGRNASGRRAVAARLVEWLEGADGIDLADLAYTLQEHREAMDWRLALVATDAAGLLATLRRYLASAGEGSATWHEGDPSTALSEDAVPHEGGDADRLAWAWARHRPVDWSASRGAGPFRRIVLPTYPFERQRCWLPEATAAENRPVDSDDTQTVVRVLLERALRVPENTLDGARPFREYGVDSVVGLGLIRALNDRFAMRLGGRVLFEHPTIDRLVKHVDTLRRHDVAVPTFVEGEGMRGALREFKAGRLTRDQLKARLERSTAA
jgi:acyl transferase domain-containing protein/aryl carrier-like protein